MSSIQISTKLHVPQSIKLRTIQISAKVLIPQSLEVKAVQISTTLLIPQSVEVRVTEVYRGELACDYHTTAEVISEANERDETKFRESDMLKREIRM